MRAQDDRVWLYIIPAGTDSRLLPVTAMTEALFQVPKRRARVYEEYNTPFPVPLNAESDRLQPTLIYRAEMVNQHVVVRDPEHIQALYGKGYFGKGILSRSRPDHSISLQWEKFGEQVLPVISLSTYQKHMSWARDVLLAQGLEEEVVYQTLQRLSQPIEAELSKKNGHKGCPASPCGSQDAGSGEPQDQALEQTGAESQVEQDSDSPQAKRPRRQGDIGFDPLAELYPKEPQKVDKVALADVQGSRHGDRLLDCGCILQTLPADRPRTDMEYVLVFDQEDEQKPVVKVGAEPGNTTGTARRVCRINPFRLLEYLQLTLEEAFFLVYGLGCLSVYNNEEPLSVMQLWQMFRAVQPHFETSYIAYHFFRSRGWVPKPGVKYGTDLMLYRKGPPFYHASYSVVVEKVIHEKVVHDKFVQEKVDQEKVDQGFSGATLRPFSWRTLAALSRITGNVSKELMLCFVIYPSDMKEEQLSSPNCISKVTVQEIILSRWISSQERTDMEDM